MTGYIHVYTGNGKGKTATAMGLAMRAIEAGFKVYVAQFLQGNGDNSLQALEKISEQVLIRKYGDQGQPLSEIRRDDRQEALEVLREICGVIHSGEYQLIILEDANIAVCHGFFMVEDLLEMVDSKPRHVDVIITGDCVAPQIIKRADLVTDMRGVKMGPDLARAASIN
jgi:cob(I)alamin adenosyltransferase